MSLKLYKPTSPARRGLVLVQRSSLWKKGPFKGLVRRISGSGGRNNDGHTTVRFRGGGARRMYRVIDFKRRSKFGVAAVVERLEYDPIRTAFIALIRYEDGVFAYIIAPQGLKIGDRIFSDNKTDVKPGNAMLLRNIPVGTVVHNVEMKPGKGGQLARSAGSFVQFVGRDQGYAILKLPSGERRLVLDTCLASVGSVSNPDNMNTHLAKAGRSRWLGRRPHVRGVVMNPVDHPHGGGEGRTSGGRHPVSPWGKSAKGGKTRRNKRTQKYILRSRHADKRGRR